VRISVYLPMLLSLALTTAAPLMARYLAPALATRTLTATTAIAAAASTWGLALLSLTLLIDTRPRRNAWRSSTQSPPRSLPRQRSPWSGVCGAVRAPSGFGTAPSGRCARCAPCASRTASSP